jgi:hypothetical protein
MQERPCRTYATNLSGDGIAHDQHYTVAELAERWHFSPNTIRRLVEDEPGVLKYGITNKKRKRRLVQLRIPERVALRVHAKLSN